MKKRRVLFNISNHPTDTWNDTQKWGWDIIDNIPFPHVGAELSSNEVQGLAKDIVYALAERLLQYPPDTCNVFVYVAGEYTTSYMIVLYLSQYAMGRKYDAWPDTGQMPELRLVVPASDRIVNKDGSREFVFLQWREIDLLLPIQGREPKGGAK